MDCKNQYKKEDCSTDLGRGCNFCNCGDEASATACEGCYKLHATDWLAEMPDMFPTDIFEVRFKNTRKGYFKNVNNLNLQKGDVVAVEASPGHDIGIVSMTGDMVARQMKRVGFTPMNGEFKKVYRKAKPYDIEKWQEAIAQEHETMIRSRQIAVDMKLNMKIGDVEFQGDNIKAIFYYIADERVDFRELIKVFAEQFRIRVEMKQIGARQEAGRIGGLGSCGRELCCASWISSFVSVTTNSARAQEISLNPQKLAGQCGKLKCCLVYELDTYLDARREFPRINQPLQAMDGEYYLLKSDILGRTMSFSTSPNSMTGLVTIPVSRVKEILEINRKGKKVDTMIDEAAQEEQVEEPNFVNVIGEDSITRFDKKGGDRKGGKSRSSGDRVGGGRGRNGSGKPDRERTEQRVDRPEGAETVRPERAERPERPARAERTERSERPERPEKTGGAPREQNRATPRPKNNNTTTEGGEPRQNGSDANGAGNGNSANGGGANRNRRNKPRPGRSGNKPTGDGEAAKPSGPSTSVGKPDKE